MNAVLHYLSTLSGPLLACVCGGILTLIPIHNVMEEPEYWYEYQIMEFFATMPLLMASILGISIYWCKFTFKKKFFSFTLTFIIGCGSYGICVMTYYLLWTYALELNLPCPFSLNIVGAQYTFAVTLAIGIRYWFRMLKCML